MNLEEALEIVANGGRVTADCLPSGAVIKLEGVGEWPKPEVRMVFEDTGSGCQFIARDHHKAADWREVSGWASYG